MFSRIDNQYSYKLSTDDSFEYKTLFLNSASTIDAILKFANTINKKKITIFDNTSNQHQYDGIGETNGINYQISNNSKSHTFSTGISSSSSQELLKILGTGNVQVLNGALEIFRTGTSNSIAITSPSTLSASYTLNLPPIAGSVGDLMYLSSTNSLNFTSIATLINSNTTDLTLNNNLSVNGDTTIGSIGTSHDLIMNGNIQIQNNYITFGSGNTISISKPTTISSSYTLKLPSTLGTTGQVLTLLNTSGDLAFTTISGGGGGGGGGMQITPQIYGSAVDLGTLDAFPISLTANNIKALEVDTTGSVNLTSDTKPNALTFSLNNTNRSCNFGYDSNAFKITMSGSEQKFQIYQQLTKIFEINAPDVTVAYNLNTNNLVANTLILREPNGNDISIVKDSTPGNQEPYTLSFPAKLGTVGQVLSLASLDGYGGGILEFANAGSGILTGAQNYGGPLTFGTITTEPTLNYNAINIVTENESRLFLDKKGCTLSTDRLDLIPHTSSVNPFILGIGFHNPITGSNYITLWASNDSTNYGLQLPLGLSTDGKPFSAIIDESNTGQLSFLPVVMNGIKDYQGNIEIGNNAATKGIIFTQSTRAVEIYDTEFNVIQRPFNIKTSNLNTHGIAIIPEDAGDNRGILIFATPGGLSTPQRYAIRLPPNIGAVGQNLQITDISYFSTSTSGYNEVQLNWVSDSIFEMYETNGQFIDSATDTVISFSNQSQATLTNITYDIFGGVFTNNSINTITISITVDCHIPSAVNAMMWLQNTTSNYRYGSVVGIPYNGETVLTLTTQITIPPYGGFQIMINTDNAVTINNSSTNFGRIHIKK